MSCFNNKCYLPQIPRVWSRVQNSCFLTTNDTRINVGQMNDMLNKGNVLQYKANSGNLTKSQKYSKIANGQWVNRNTTWATQSDRGYTNPNTTNLKRSGNVVNLAIDPITGAILGPTNAPITCPQLVIPINYYLPSNGGGGASVYDPNIPPPPPPPVVPPNNINDFPPIIPDTLPTEPIVVQDGGVLICSVQENICTGTTNSTISQQLCHPTTDSDVPGTIQELCWNDGTPTWYPRTRYIMTNSTNKWPVNATLGSAIKPFPPVITSASAINNIATLTWTQDETCIPVTQFIIYVNNLLVKIVNGNVFTTEFSIVSCITNDIYIVGTNGNIVSDNSNIVNVIDTQHYTVTGVLI